MLYDVYIISPGEYRYVGPYRHDDPAAHKLMETSDGYVTTVGSLSDAMDAAADDNQERGGRGVIGKSMTLDEAIARLT